MSDEQQQKVDRMIENFKKEVDSKLERLKLEIHNEFALKQSDINHTLDSHDKDITTHSKIFTYIAVAVGGAILLALLRTIGL